MSLTEVRNVVLLFSNPVWAGSASVPASLVRNITSLSGSLGREESINRNLTTLSSNNAETLNGVIQGLLYVPEIPASDPCSESQYDDDVGLPRNVTHRSDLPPTNYKLIAIAPFFSKECTKAYLKATRFHTVRGFIFYKVNNFTTKPPEADNPSWDIDDGGAWLQENPYPIFAIPGLDGQNLVNRLAKYSGSIEDAPHGKELIETYGPNPRDYIRIWAELTMKDSDSLPALWTFFVIVIGSLLVIIAFISFFLHMVQRRRRHHLAERVKKGFDLETQGIARVVLPEQAAKKFRTFTYQIVQGSEPPTPGAASTAPSRSEFATSAQDRSIQTGRNRTPPGLMGLIDRNLTDSDMMAATNKQYICHLCEDAFQHRKSIIRQLDCGHIFHPECIDEYLTRNSSLCPICRMSMMPSGYSPRITNGMVRRYRALTRYKGTMDLEMEPSEDGKNKIRIFQRPFWKEKTSSQSDEIVLQSVREKTPPEEVPLPPSTTTSPAPTTATEVTPEAAVTPPDPAPLPSRAPSDSGDKSTTPAATATYGRPRRPKKKRKAGPALDLQPPPEPPDESGAQWDHQVDGRLSPTPETRARMQDLANEVGPEGENRALWRKAVSKLFPGIV